MYLIKKNKTKNALTDTKYTSRAPADEQLSPQVSVVLILRHPHLGLTTHTAYTGPSFPKRLQ